MWIKDEEFGRQTLAGINPCSIQLVKVYMLHSYSQTLVPYSLRNRISSSAVCPTRADAKKMCML